MATFDDFAILDIRAGTIISASLLEGARKPAYELEVDLGSEIGIKRSSAQITDCYTPDELIGRQVLAVVNFPPRRVAGYESEVLVLGVYADQGVVLIQPQQPVKDGDKLG